MDRKIDGMISPRARQLLGRLRAIDTSSSLADDHVLNILLASAAALRRGDIALHECSAITEESRHVRRDIRAQLQKL